MTTTQPFTVLVSQDGFLVQEEEFDTLDECRHFLNSFEDTEDFNFDLRHPNGELETWG